jgi:hypothetical protein
MQGQHQQPLWDSPTNLDPHKTIAHCRGSAQEPPWPVARPKSFFKATSQAFRQRTFLPGQSVLPQCGESLRTALLRLD